MSRGATNDGLFTEADRHPEGARCGCIDTGAGPGFCWSVQLVFAAYDYVLVHAATWIIGD
jgi:hypothetical protein